MKIALIWQNSSPSWLLFTSNFLFLFQVYRQKFRLYIETAQREKVNGQMVYIGIHPSKVEIVKLKIDKSRMEILERRALGRLEATGHKFQAGRVTSNSILFW